MKYTIKPGESVMQDGVMDDRELLELVAKACGLEVVQPIGDSGFFGLWVRCVGRRRQFRWNPLQDDGDALRLAVKLGLEIYKGNDEAGDLAGVVYFIEGQSRPKIAMEYHKDHNDAFSATRRAITRAAAQMIGEP